MSKAASETYVMVGGVPGRERLRVLGRVMRPSTVGLLERAGVRRGMECLDAGCGGGDVTALLARWVGPEGRVVGMDIDEGALALARAEAEALELGNVEFQHGDLRQLEGVESRDLIYVRFVLSHLQDPGPVLERMFRALRPGGTLVVEDIECGGVFSYPRHEAFHRSIELYAKAVLGRGCDPELGPKLPSLLRAAGLRDVEVQVVQPAAYKGELKSLPLLTLQNTANAVRQGGLAAEGELEELLRRLEDLVEDESCLIGIPRVTQSWGRRL